MHPPLYFASDPRPIGAHLWRVVVTDSKFGGRRFAYEFSEPDQLEIWRDQTDWPGFTLDALALGLPRSLALLYADNADTIRAALICPDVAAFMSPTAQWWALPEIDA